MTSDDELLARAVAESEKMLGESGMGRAAAAAATATDDGDADSGGVPIPSGMLPLLKPHQVEGVRFMLRNTADNNGCVLAHSMGLGKTCQVVTLFAALLQGERAEGACRTALVLAPVSTLPNWRSEIGKWAKLGGLLKKQKNSSADAPPVSRIFAPQLDKGSRHRQGDLATFKSWEKQGGVLLMGYERYAAIVSEKKAPRAELEAAVRFLRDPGPDLLICDEGHRLKTADGRLTQAVCKVSTARRIILTGTPLQNNMTEYFTMLNFVRRDFYAKSWFELFFRRPIESGQRFNAPPEDVALMRARSYVLSKELAPFVLRKDQSILKATLPPKREYVIGVPLTEFQGVLYAAFAREYFDPENGVRRNLLGYVAATTKLSAHPSVFRRFLKWRRNEARSEEKEGWIDPVLRICDERETATGKENFRFCDSAKVQVLLYLLQGYVERREKVLVFTQSTETLDYIKGVLQELLGKMLSDGGGKKKDPKWLFKLDGRNTLSERAAAIDGFQRKTGTFAVFLISTMAGGVGVNLNTAHGAVMFDVAYNPAHDQQAVFRCYRYGLKHAVSIYRLVSLDTPESTIYARCVSKEWVAKKVVDEASTTRAHITTTSLQELFKEEEQWAKDPKLPRGGSSGGIAGHLADYYATERATCLARDPVLSHTASKLRQRGVELTQIYRHESLLVDDVEEEAGEEEQLEYQRYISSSEGFHNTLGSGRWGGDDDDGVDALFDPYGNDAEERSFAQAVRASAQTYRAELDERRLREKADSQWEEELLRSGIGGFGGRGGGSESGNGVGTTASALMTDDYTFLDGLGASEAPQATDDNGFWAAAVGPEEVEAIDVDGAGGGSPAVEDAASAAVDGSDPFEVVSIAASQRSPIFSCDPLEAVSIADSERDSTFSLGLSALDELDASSPLPSPVQAEMADHAVVDGDAMDDAAAEPVPVLPAESPPPEAEAAPVGVPPAPTVDQPVSVLPPGPPPPSPVEEAADDTRADAAAVPVPVLSAEPPPEADGVPPPPLPVQVEGADTTMVDDAAAEPVPVLPAEPPAPEAEAAPVGVPPTVGEVSPAPEPVVVKKKRGRPRKVVAEADIPLVPPVKRGRGRPRKEPVSEPVKRGRGRPRNVPVAEADGGGSGGGVPTARVGTRREMDAQPSAAAAAAKQLLQEMELETAAAAAADEGLSYSFFDTDEEEDAVGLTEEQQVALAIRRSALEPPRKAKKGKKDKKEKKARKRDRLARAMEEELDTEGLGESPRKRRRTVAAFSRDDDEEVDSDSDAFEQHRVRGLTEEEQVALALAQSQEQSSGPHGGESELQQALSLSLALSRSAPGLGADDDDDEEEGEDVEGGVPYRALPPLRPEDFNRSAFDVPPPIDKSRN